MIAIKEIDAIGFDAPSPGRGEISSGTLSGFPAFRILCPKGIAIYQNLKNVAKLLNTKFVGAPLYLVRVRAARCISGNGILACLACYIEASGGPVCGIDSIVASVKPSPSQSMRLI